jgi:transposase
LKRLVGVGCSLLPLPPYSPDLNKIEPHWNTIKAKIALNQNIYDSFRLKVDAAFLIAYLYEVL